MRKAKPLLELMKEIGENHAHDDCHAFDALARLHHFHGARVYHLLGDGSE